MNVHDYGEQLLPIRSLPLLSLLLVVDVVQIGNVIVVMCLTMRGDWYVHVEAEAVLGHGGCLVEAEEAVGGQAHRLIARVGLLHTMHARLVLAHYGLFEALGLLAIRHADELVHARRHVRRRLASAIVVHSDHACRIHAARRVVQQAVFVVIGV